MEQNIEKINSGNAENTQSYEEMRLLYKRPLTKEEAAFSAEHLSLVWWYLNTRGLEENEWFDVVIFRYMLTVKRWFTDEALHAYSFTTLAVAAMRSAVSTEQRKQARRVQTVSLNAPIKGTHGLTLEDSLAA